MDLYRGSASGLLSSPSWSFADAGGEASRSAASAGDVNGDGFDDVLVGSHCQGGPGREDGRVSLFLGSASGLSAAPSWSFDGEPFSQLGYSVGGAGDVNGDGYSDFLLGAPGDLNFPASSAGRVSLYLGSATGPSDVPAWSVRGSEPGDRLGASIAGAGDVNGDGYSDILIGVPGGGGDDAGVVEVYLGSSTGPSREPEWRLSDRLGATGYGERVASAGDVNGDGYSDFAVQHSRSTDLHLGSPSGPSMDPAWDFFLAGDARALAPGGDVNGDGYSDLLHEVDAFSGTGRAAVFLGNEGILPPEPGFFDLSGGLPLAVRQRRADDSAPVDALGQRPAPGAFRVRAALRAPRGRARVRLEVEVKPLRVPFDGRDLVVSPDMDTGPPGPDGSRVEVSLTVTPETGGPHHWRARMRSDSAPIPWRGRWISPAFNAATETDLGLPCGRAPTGTHELRVSATTLTWSGVWCATSHDVIAGDLTALVSTRGDFSSSMLGCVANDLVAGSTPWTDVPGADLFFLVRSTDATGGGSYESARATQYEARDPEIAAAPGVCP